VPVIAVDYDDVPALKALLEKHNVHTVLSTVNTVAPGAIDNQNNLIRAAEQSSSTKRFAPSEYAAHLSKEYVSSE